MLMGCVLHFYPYFALRMIAKKRVTVPLLMAVTLYKMIVAMLLHAASQTHHPLQGRILHE